MVPASLKGKYVIRFTVTSQKTTEEDIAKDWSIIAEAATGVLNDERVVDGVETIDEVFEEEVEDEDEGVFLANGDKKEVHRFQTLMQL